MQQFGLLVSRINQGDGGDFGRWLFEPGMAFGDMVSWWRPAPARRAVAHEGVDFYRYEDRYGRHQYMADRLVPAPCRCRIVAVCDDFLGRSLFLVPQQPVAEGQIFVFGHITPLVEIGRQVQAGDVVGRVTTPQGRVPGHLHVSCLQGDWRHLPQQLSWPTLLAEPGLRFVRPFAA
ncbi:MAG: hypothetical protein C0613_08995 [Desulfobulbaceae bacterium]|nr:MAG: hypothetical protein C0613_08995 [Desulfobulbaceae bacterium]